MLFLNKGVISFIITLKVVSNLTRKMINISILSLVKEFVNTTGNTTVEIVDSNKIASFWQKEAPLSKIDFQT